MRNDDDDDDLVMMLDWEAMEEAATARLLYCMVVLEFLVVLVDDRSFGSC